MTSRDNAVLIGKKDTMSYVLACIQQFNEGADEVRIMARGNAIKSAVDVAERVRNNFVSEATVGDVQIGTDEVKAKNGDKLNVSTIEILLAKQAQESN